MLALQQVGTSYYLRDTEKPGLYHRLSYPQYQTFMDWLNLQLSFTDLWRRLDYYNRMKEEVLCPLCDQGTLPRDTIHLLLMADAQSARRLHKSLIHGTLE